MWAVVLMIERIDCIALVKKYQHRKDTDNKAVKKVVKTFVVIFFLSFTGTALLLYLAPAFVTAYVVVLLIILVILVFKQIKIMISVKITSKDNLLYNICKPYSLIQHYKNKSSYESIEIDEVIEHFKSFRVYLGNEASFTGRSGYDFHANYYKFIRLLRKSIKVYFLPRLEKVEELDHILYAIQEIANYISSEKFSEGITYFESTLDVKLDKTTSLMDIWESFNKFKLRDTSISLLISLLITIVYILISRKYDLFIKLGMPYWFTSMLAILGGSYKIAELYVPVLIQYINIRLNRVN